MGHRDMCCHCLEAWEDFINHWVFVILTNDSRPLSCEEWQLKEVHENYLVLRRPGADRDGWKKVIIPCQHVVALIEASEPRPRS